MDGIDGRKRYIDNLRTLTVLLLFPYHTFMIYNNWGEAFYIHGADLVIPSVFVGIFHIWMMPMLFALAGMSTYYALNRRSSKEYAKERTNRLFVPFVFGLLLLIPVQSYIAGLSHNGEANFFDFFTKFTDLQGYDGGFTPGHLWFILFLFVFSIVFLPLMMRYRGTPGNRRADRMPFIVLMLLGVFPMLVNQINLESLFEYAALFLLGYFVLSSENVLVKLDRYRFPMFGIMVVCMGLTIYFDFYFLEMVSWLSILALLGMARHYLNFSGRTTKYLSRASFGLYLFHQTWIVVVAYFIFGITGDPLLQIPLIMLSAVLLTFASYEVCRRIPIIKRMFGLDKGSASRGSVRDDR